MSDFIILTISGLGLAALYFLLAAGLALIFGLMGVLNFAHGVFLTVGSYGAWWSTQHLQLGGPVGTFVIALGVGCLVGLAVSALVESLLIRPLYGRQLQQVLVTVGLALALTALVEGVWGSNAWLFPVPAELNRTVEIAGGGVPISQFVVIGAAVAVWLGLSVLIRFTRFGIVIRAGVQNRAMVSALGVNVSRAFLVVFSIGGLVAAFGGALTGVYYGSIDPTQGQSLLIFALIVVVIGGLGSIDGAALAALAVALVQEYVNFYGAAYEGDLVVYLLLAAVLLVRPQGLAGTAHR